MDRLETIKLFLRVADAGSFSKAARQLGIVQSTVSKQIAVLEERLGAQLVRRTSRGLALTAAGTHYREEAIRLVDALEALDDAVSDRERSPVGMVRVSAPPGFVGSYLVPGLGALVAKHPQLTFDFTVAQRIVNLMEDRIDVAIRIGDLEDSELRSRHVGTVKNIVVASPAYLLARGEPRTPAELEGHACIASMRRGRPRPWQFGEGPTREVVVPRGPIQSDDSELTRAAVKSGLGVAYAASWLFKEELASGAVRRILADHDGLRVPLSAVWSGDRALPRRAAVFIDFLATVCAADPTLRIR